MSESEIIAEVRPAKIIFVKPGFGFLVALICGYTINPVFYVIILWPVIVLLEWLRTRIVLTETRLYGAKGVLSVETFDLRLDKIESILFSQSLLGRMNDFGDLQIRGTGSTKITFQNIAEAQWFKQEVDDQLDQIAAGARQLRGRV